MVVRYHSTIKQLPEEMRPREKLTVQGEQYLSEAELLAIILGSGTRALSAIELADDLIARNKGLHFIKTMSISDLQSIDGIGLAKASRIKAALELGRRLASQDARQREQISSPEDVKDLVMEDMRYLDREYFKCLYLDRKNKFVALDTISVGGLSSSLVHPREVFKPAVKLSAASVILIHNHPSGDPTPSSEDIDITKRLVDSGKILGIDVLDHLVIGDGRYVSLKSANMI